MVGVRCTPEPLHNAAVAPAGPISVAEQQQQSDDALASVERVSADLN
jgi:hypothetical protein